MSYDGHAFSTGAYATDFIEKVWPMNYGRAGGEYLSEGGGATRNAYGNITAPAQGYIWDACQARRRERPQLRRVRGALRGGDADARRPAGHAARETWRRPSPASRASCTRRYPPYDLTRPGQPAGGRVAGGVPASSRRAAACPRLSILRLGNDHTAGTRPGYPTPRAMVAENDLALGRLVEAITESRFWKESAIFVLEDDAQNGPDHVDAHRSVALVISPYTRRGAVDSTLYTTSGDAAHDRADPRPAAHEPIRRRGHAHVRRLPGHARS